MKRHFTLLLSGILACFCLTSFGQTCTGNLLPNPGFESGLTGWNTDGGNVSITSDAHSGTKAAKLGGSGYSFVGFILPTTPGKNYSMKAWAKTTGSIASYQCVGIRFLNASYVTIPVEGSGNFDIGTDYTEVTNLATAPLGAAYVYAIASKDGPGGLQVDDWCLTEEGSTFLPDLVVNNIQVPSVLNVGVPFPFSCVVKNIGTAASAATYLHVELGNGVDITDIAVAALQIGQELTVSQQLLLPAGSETGSAVIEVKIDAPNNAVQELAELNNIAISQAFTINANGNCSITASASNTQCNDNGTPMNPADDKFSFILTATNLTQSAGYGVFIPQTSQFFQGTYGSPLNIQNVPISTGNLTLNLTDDVMSGCSASVTVTPPAPCSDGGTGQIDLSLTLQQLTASPAIYSNYAVKATVSNAGPQAATDVKVKFAKPNGVVYVGGNQFTASQGTFNPNGDEVWTVGSIPANGSATLTVNYFLLNATAPVAYAQVSAQNETDLDSQPNNGTPPTPVQDDEAATSGSNGPATQPDLTIADLQIPTVSVAAGAILNYNFDASNAGTAAVPGSFTIKSYISTDNTLSANDIQDGNIPTGNYAAGFAVQNVAGASTIPASLAAGGYFLIVKIDADNGVAESNENNNVVVKPFTVTGGSPPQPDLTISDLQIQNTSLAAGLTLNYTYDFSNIGTVGFSSAYSIKSYLSTDNTLSANDIEELVGMDANFSPGFVQDNIPGNSTVPPGFAAGNYFLILKVDGDNVVTEGNETNNTVSLPFTVINLGGGDACEKSLAPGGLVCSEKTTAGNYRLAISPQSGTAYKRYEFTPGGNLVSNLTDVAIPSTLKIENGKVVERAGGTGLVIQEITIPASLISQYHPKVVCRQTGTGNFFMGGSNFGPESVFLKLDASLNVLSSVSLPGSVAQAIVPTSWGGAVFAAGYQASLPSAGANGFLYVISSSAGLLYSQQVAYFVNSALPLPCGTDAFRFIGFFGGGGGGANIDLDIESDFSFTQQAAQRLRTRNTGYSFISPLPLVFQTTHYFYNPDGTNWQIIRRVQATAPQYNIVATDSAWYEKRSATDQLLLHQPLNKTVMSQYIYGIAEIETGKLAFFGTKNGQAWHYHPFCGGTTPPTGCAAITLTPGHGKITIAGFSAPHVLIKVFKPNWTLAFECLDGTCSNPQVVSGLSIGTHHVQVKLLNSGWGEICFLQQDVTVSSLSGGNGSNALLIPDDRFRLAFDKFYPNPASHWLNVVLFLPKEQAVTLDFYNQQGRRVHTLEVQLEEGRNTLELEVSDWKSGTYNVIARGEGLPAYGRFLKVWEE